MPQVDATENIWLSHRFKDFESGWGLSHGKPAGRLSHFTPEPVEALWNLSPFDHSRMAAI